MKVLGSGPFSYRIALTVHVDAGQQYRLREITFGGNRAIIDIQALRKLFPLRDGDLLSRAAIAKGLENLRNAYLQLGYINFTSIPNTQIDEQSRTMGLRIDVDEGKQFFISGIRIVGLDEHASGNLMKQSLLRRGDIYNQRLADLFLQKHASLLPPNVSPGSRIHRRLNEQAGTVAIAYDFGPCPAE
jgi:outer membrane protein insertion porin family